MVGQNVLPVMEAAALRTNIIDYKQSHEIADEEIKEGNKYIINMLFGGVKQLHNLQFTNEIIQKQVAFCRHGSSRQKDV